MHDSIELENIGKFKKLYESLEYKLGRAPTCREILKEAKAMRAKIKAYNEVYQNLFKKFGREPTSIEIGKKLVLPIKERKRIEEEIFGGYHDPEYYDSFYGKYEDVKEPDYHEYIRDDDDDNEESDRNIKGKIINTKTTKEKTQTYTEKRPSKYNEPERVLSDREIIQIEDKLDMGMSISGIAGDYGYDDPYVFLSDQHKILEEYAKRRGVDLKHLFKHGSSLGDQYGDDYTF